MLPVKGEFYRSERISNQMPRTTKSPSGARELHVSVSVPLPFYETARSVGTTTAFLEALMAPAVIDHFYTILCALSCSNTASAWRKSLIEELLKKGLDGRKIEYAIWGFLCAEETIRCFLQKKYEEYGLKETTKRRSPEEVRLNADKSTFKFGVDFSFKFFYLWYWLVKKSTSIIFEDDFNMHLDAKWRCVEKNSRELANLSQFFEEKLKGTAPEAHRFAVNGWAKLYMSTIFFSGWEYYQKGLHLALSQLVLGQSVLNEVEFAVSPTTIQRPF